MRRLFIVILILFSSVTQAATYKWITGGRSSTASASPSASCTSFASSQTASMPYHRSSVKGVTKVNDTNFSCLIDVYAKQGGQWTSEEVWNIARHGDTCPPETPNYNPAHGVCYSGEVPERCPAGTKQNAETLQCDVVVCPQTDSHEKLWSSTQNKCAYYFNLQDQEMCDFMNGKNSVQDHTYTSTDPNGATQATDPANKCGMNMTKKTCTTTTDGVHKCVGRGTYNGSYNPNGTKPVPGTCENGQTNCTSEAPKTEPQDPQPEKTSEQKPCTYVSVNGTLTCTSTKVEEQQGTKNCGTVNGVWGCQASPPSKNGIEIKSKVESKSNPDGSTSTTKTDTATQTYCKNIGDCITKTTTTTTTTTKDANGNTTSVTGSCKGDNCPDVNTNPDGNGDGIGDCVGDSCGEGGGGEGPGDAELEEVPTFGESAESFLARVQDAPIPNAISHLRAPSGGSCPKYSENLGQYGTIKYDSHCILIEEKRSLISLIAKTLWALLALWIVVG